MLEKLAGADTAANAMKWGASLAADIKTGPYSTLRDTWVEGVDVGDAVGSAGRWASDANGFVCSYVLQGGVTAVQGKDLSGAYYEGAVPIFSEQIAKGGYRLATWLNMIAAAEGKDELAAAEDLHLRGREL